MIIVRIKGGLGNQMFQYSLGKSLQLKGKEVIYDTSFYNDEDVTEKVMLEEIFGIKFNIASRNIIRAMSDENKSIIHKIRRRLIGRKKSHYREKSLSDFDKNIFEIDNCLIDGYWQSDKYFFDCSEKIKESYKFNEANLNSLQKKYLKHINSCNAVGIHIRRGDYMYENNQKMFGNICNANYYDYAMSYINNRLSNVQYFVFSNDSEWVYNNMKYDNITIVDNRSIGENGPYDMYLMSKCKHNIIANSSYSWWAAWLNTNDDKIIIAPSKWFNNHETPDIWCNDWIKI